jgi:hypothetical protein
MGKHKRAPEPLTPEQEEVQKKARETYERYQNLVDKPLSGKFSHTKVHGKEWFNKLKDRIEREIARGAKVEHHLNPTGGIDRPSIAIFASDYLISVFGWAPKLNVAGTVIGRERGFTIAVCKGDECVLTFAAKSPDELKDGQEFLTSLQPKADKADDKTKEERERIAEEQGRGAKAKLKKAAEEFLGSGNVPEN